MVLRFLMTGLVVTALSVPTLQAQTLRRYQDRPTVQMPGRGQVMIGVQLSDVTDR